MAMKQLKMNVYTNVAVRVMKALLAAYVVTGLLLLLIAGLLYRFQLDEGKVQIGIIVTYILSCFVGGFFVGRAAGAFVFFGDDFGVGGCESGAAK